MPASAVLKLTLPHLAFSAEGCAGVQVKVQTTPGWAKGLSDGLPKFVAEQGVAG